jgi:hypothetical protein
MRLIVYAPSISAGGGMVLLEEFLKGAPKDIDLILIHSSKFNSFAESRIVHSIAIKNILHRFFYEIYLILFLNKNDILLCFGNLPPMLKHKCKTYVYLQNKFIISNEKFYGLKYKQKVKNFFLRSIFLVLKKNASHYFVQTQSMNNLLRNIISTDKTITIFPFASLDKIGFNKSRESLSGSLNSRFIYPAFYNEHKNHHNLLLAWGLLAEENIYPELVLTINAEIFKRLLNSEVLLKHAKNLKIFNLGEVKHKLIVDEYKNADALIFPSFHESFGLPLLEARNFNIPVLASELDFVRDILDPHETFDPNSPVSISRAIKRFLGYKVKTSKVFLAADLVKFMVNLSVKD